MDTFYKIVHLLNDLNSKKQIRVWQYKRMMPQKDKMKLAYLYFIPKAHKVIIAIFTKIFSLFHICAYFYLGRDTITTYRFIY
jgi:hypothetical protein